MRNNKNAFTLVELLAVIVILAIILVIAVPKVMEIITDAKKGTLESTAKMIASAAEKAKVQNTVLSKNDTINCEDVVKLNNVDYERCIIEFDEDNNAFVSIKGKGKFSNLNVCDGDKTTATATNTNCSVSYGNGATYIEKLEAFNGSENKLEKKSVEYNGITYDAGIRYVGALTGDNAVKNKVYFNCEPTDGTNAYGSENYNYASSCEVWRIIGVFEVDNGNGVKEKRLKIINTASTFTASWDSSKYVSNTDHENGGRGINQWGPSVYNDGTIYEGADLMQLLNGYYIGASGATCKYCNDSMQEICAQVCDREESTLASQKMKPLTSITKKMIKNAVWDTYVVRVPENNDTTIDFARKAFLEEKGISARCTGKTFCVANGGNYCNDNVKRTTLWTGLVGLMSISDITYANGWLSNPNGASIYPWSITPFAGTDNANIAWRGGRTLYGNDDVSNAGEVWPATYLSSNVEIIDGDGNNDPYILK